VQSCGVRHPREMGVAHVEAFLSMLTNDQVAGLLAPVEGVTVLLAAGAVSPLDSLLQA
jgi:hypothetical protein